MHTSRGECGGDVTVVKVEPRRLKDAKLRFHGGTPQAPPVALSRLRISVV
jgi:hypothetical protein